MRSTRAVVISPCMPLNGYAIGNQPSLPHLLQQSAEVVTASLAAVEESFSSSTHPGAAPNEARPSLLAAAMSSSLSAAPVASSQAMTTEESMELDSHKEASALTTASSKATDPIAPGSLNVIVVTDIATAVAPKARTSSSINTTNVVSKCWADIVSNKEALSLQMDKQAGWTTTHSSQ
ncbi:hypothetical protein C0989_006980 [Termitomyces sp. Mn162]|nr:hypothetical protein C0989_006980 [Termitomyces sp. Mn162]